MFCPSCNAALHEFDAACGRCAFSLAVCDAQFGLPPLLSHPVSDPKHHLSRLSHSTIVKAAQHLEQRFPQLRITTLVHSKPDSAEPKPYLFWIFNRGSLHNALEKAGSNHHILLWIDPAAKKMSSMVGYGLEPVLGHRPIQDALCSASPYLLTHQYAQATIAFIRELDRRLVELRHQLDTTFGWHPDQDWIALDEPAGENDLERLHDTLLY
jgi:uncharacterized membrane protein YgcG